MGTDDLDYFQRAEGPTHTLGRRDGREYHVESDMFSLVRSVPNRLAPKHGVSELGHSEVNRKMLRGETPGNGSHEYGFRREAAGIY